MNRQNLKAFLKSNRWAWLLLVLLLSERLIILHQLGPEYSLGSDDLSYLQSGLIWSRTGMITMHEPYPSAQVMPGMTIIIGLFALLFKEGTGLWLALKLLWIGMGTAAAWMVYRSVALFAPKWCGLIAMACFLRPDFAWMDNLLLTETPFLLALSGMVYFTLKMGRHPGWRSFWGCLLFYLAGLLLKANIAPYPLLALAYLVAAGYDRKLLKNQCVTVAGAMLCLLLPWMIRNYLQFHAFVPLTYGAGNPMLLGTYQGVGWPADEELDYTANVDQVVRERYAYYYQPDGDPKPEYARYLRLQRDLTMAKYRQRVWRESDMVSFLSSYLLRKPRMMVAAVFYWEPVFGVSANAMKILEKLDLMLCAGTGLLAFLLKKRRREVVFLWMVYLVNLYVYALTYAFERYNASLMPVRFILVGLGVGLVAGILSNQGGVE